MGSFYKVIPEMGLFLNNFRDGSIFDVNFQRKRQQQWRFEHAATRGGKIASTNDDFVPAGLASLTSKLVPAHVSPNAVAIKPCTSAAVASGGAQARAKTAKSIGSVYSECVTSFSLNSWFFLLWFSCAF